jgi:hypothetical protein
MKLERKFLHILSLSLIMCFTIGYSLYTNLNAEALTKTTTCDNTSTITLNGGVDSSIEGGCEISSFNYHRGSLQGVNLDIQSEITSNIVVENTLEDDQLVSGDWSVNLAHSSQRSEFNESAFGIFDTLNGFDGEQDFDGDSARSFPAITNVESIRSVITAPGELETFQSPSNDTTLIPIGVNAQQLSLSPGALASVSFDVRITLVVEYLYNLPDIAIVLDSAKVAAYDTLFTVTLDVINFGHNILSGGYTILFSSNQTIQVTPAEGTIEVIGNESQTEFSLLLNEEDNAIDTSESVTIPLEISVPSNEESTLLLRAKVLMDGYEKDKSNNSDSHEVQLIDQPIANGSLEVAEFISNQEEFVFLSQDLIDTDITAPVNAIRFDSIEPLSGSLYIRSDEFDYELVAGSIVTTQSELLFVPSDNFSGLTKISYTLLDSNLNTISDTSIEFNITDLFDEYSENFTIQKSEIDQGDSILEQSTNSLVRTGGSVISSFQEVYSFPVSDMVCDTYFSFSIL